MKVKKGRIRVKKAFLDFPCSGGRGGFQFFPQFACEGQGEVS
jgi:hypothetical protein